MKLRSVIANLLIFLITCLSSALFHQTENLKVDEILPVKFEAQPQSSSRFQRVGIRFNSILFHDKTNAWLVTRSLELMKVKL